MALWIQNITPDNRPDTEEHEYRIMINQLEIGRFRHVRAEGAAECFRRAADALDREKK